MLYSKFLKFLIDFLIAFLVLLFLTPILILVMLLLLISNKGDIFFLQHRPGYQQKIFKLIKFKTMSDKRDAQGNLITENKNKLIS